MANEDLKSLKEVLERMQADLKEQQRLHDASKRQEPTGTIEMVKQKDGSYAPKKK